MCLYASRQICEWSLKGTHHTITTKKSIILKLEKNKHKRQNSISKASSEKIWLFNGNLLFLSALNWNDIHTPKTRFKVIFWLLTERSFKRARAHSLVRRSLVGWLAHSLAFCRALTHSLHAPKTAQSKQWKSVLKQTFDQPPFSLNCFVTRLCYTFCPSLSLS